MEASLEAEVDVIELEEIKDKPMLKTLKGSLLQFAVGAAIVVGGSRLLVYSAVEIAGALNIPSIIIGLTVVAVGTSLPELVTMVSSLKHHASDLAIGNILGANVANLTFVVGSAASISPVSMTRLTQLINFPAMMLQPIFLYYLVFTDKKISRREGVILLSFYVIYLAVLICIAPMQRTG